MTLPPSAGDGGECAAIFWADTSGEEGSGELLGTDADTPLHPSGSCSGTSESDSDCIDWRSSPSSVSISLLFDEEA